jgi:hypothetical protein
MILDKDDKEWIEAVIEDKVNHTKMSHETSKTIKKMEKSMDGITSELRRLSDNDIRRDEQLKTIIGKLEKMDDKYVTKDELGLVEERIKPMKKIVYGAVIAVLVAFMGALTALVFIT